jgi:putative Holliday junction resolvase
VRIAALDVGEVRIGVAVCDELEIGASPVSTVRRVGSLKRDIAQVIEVIERLEAELILVGMPTSSDGGEGPQAKRVRGFGDALANSTPKPIAYWDESLTTVEAEERLITLGYSRQKRRELIDQWAAKVLLESYLEHRTNKS